MTLPRKVGIKVIKRSKKDAAVKTPIVIDASKIESDTQLIMSNTVSNWISEQRETNQKEKSFSDNKILGWKLTP